MLHSLEHVRDHQNPLAGTPTLVSCQAPQLGRPRFAAEKVCRHPPSPKHSTLAYQLYHIWGSPEAGITSRCGRSFVREPPWLAGREWTGKQGLHFVVFVRSPSLLMSSAATAHAAAPANPGRAGSASLVTTSASGARQRVQTTRSAKERLRGQPSDPRIGLEQ